VVYNFLIHEQKNYGGKMKTFDYTAVVWKEKEGYVSKCPELGVASCGDSISNATENLKEAVSLYLENAEALGLLEDIKESLTTSEKFTSHMEVVM
jgi:predicted RNase H-like HicB family nuclease